MGKERALETILWSIALPGFGQLLNGKLIKGSILIGLEFLINFNSHLNQVIMHSFHGDMAAAVHDADYGWLMFYPCVYMFGIWDAHRDTNGNEDRYLFLPYVIAAYLGTIGLIYSPQLQIFGILPGPIFLPIVCFLLGSAVGILLRKLLLR